MKTEEQVITDMMDMIKADRFAHLINGQVYRQTMRPRNSQMEDITVAVTAIDGDYQIQNGFISVMCYVPDIQPYADGVYVKDSFRIEELQYVAKTFAESLTCEVSNYRFAVRTLTSIPIDEIHQHAISLQLSFQYVCTDDDEQPVLISEDGDILVTGCAYLTEDALIEIV